MVNTQIDKACCQNSLFSKRSIMILFSSSNPTRLGFDLLLLLCLVLGVVACGTRGPLDRQPIEFTEAPSPYAENPYPNWPLPPHSVEADVVELLNAEYFHFVAEKHTGRGTTGAAQVTVAFPRFGKEISFKWKEAPRGDLDNFNNSPRREIAAYEVQKLFLEPKEYVVPPSTMVCPPRAIHIKHFGRGRATVKGTDCVLGNISLWLEDVTLPEKLYDGSRFIREPNYAYFLSNLNLLTYLIAHRDARYGNFVVSKDDTRRHVFSIDNGESFGSFPYNFFVANWDVIRVPALRKESIDRLRKLQRSDLDVLGVVSQLEADENGVLRPMPAGENLDPEKGVRIQGKTVQFGLTRAEIEKVWKRIQQLLSDVDKGNIRVF